MPAASSAARREPERRAAGEREKSRAAPGRRPEEKRRPTGDRGRGPSGRQVPGKARSRANSRPRAVSSGKRSAAQPKTAKKTTQSRAAAKSERRAVAAARAHMVYLVLVPTAALLLLGLVMVFSAGSIIGMGQQMGAYKYFVQQVCWAVFGLALLVFFWKIDYHKLGRFSWAGVLITIALLALVLHSGSSAFGARRWLSIGPINLQPTEIAKFVLVVFAAYVFSIKGDKLKHVFHVLVPVVLITLVESALILMQPDLGSTIVLCASVFLLLGVSRAKPGHVLAMGATGTAAALYFALSAPYRRARLFSFVDPWKSARGAGYQVIQSYIALGSGGVKGLGLGMSRQKFLYLPNAHTDFIFAIIGEELGMLGTLTVLALLGILAYGGLKIASRAPDEMGRLLAVGITGLIIIQALVNTGGVTGLLPITGVPLPLVSSGGSSLCICMGCIGILLNIASQGSR